MVMWLLIVWIWDVRMRGDAIIDRVDLDLDVGVWDVRMLGCEDVRM